jgi:hypothetical protein
MLVRSARRLGVDHEKIAIKYGPLDEGERVRPKIPMLECLRVGRQQACRRNSTG